MITVESSCYLIVAHPVNGSLAYNPGRWTFDRLDSVRGYTNQIIDVSWCPDGTVVLLDINGWHTIQPGVRLAGPAMDGFILALMTIGLMLFFRQMARRLSSAWGGGSVE